MNGSSDNFQYKLSKNQKEETAGNLIDILQNNAAIAPLTQDFIYNWVTTTADEKRKAFFDVCDLVLKHYMPTYHPVLFRACNRLSGNGKIASFTGRLECASRFSNGKGYLIVCDTHELLRFEDLCRNSDNSYLYTFYPLVEVLKKAKACENPPFSERFLTKYIGEDEYIMRINFSYMHRFKWCE